MLLQPNYKHLCMHSTVCTLQYTTVHTHTHTHEHTGSGLAVTLYDILTYLGMKESCPEKRIEPGHNKTTVANTVQVLEESCCSR